MAYYVIDKKLAQQHVVVHCLVPCCVAALSAADVQHVACCCGTVRGCAYVRTVYTACVN